MSTRKRDGQDVEVLFDGFDELLLKVIGYAIAIVIADKAGKSDDREERTSARVALANLRDKLIDLRIVCFVPFRRGSVVRSAGLRGRVSDGGLDGGNTWMLNGIGTAGSDNEAVVEGDELLGCLLAGQSLCVGNLPENGRDKDGCECSHHESASSVPESVIFIDDAGLSSNPKNNPFPTSQGRGGLLSVRPMSHADAYRMIRRRAIEAKIATKIGNHSLCGTGITELITRE
jgi:hypothetical protein